MRSVEHHIREAASLHERVVAMKQQSRAQDEESLTSGRLTAVEITRKNTLVSGWHVKLDLGRGGRLR